MSTQHLQSMDHRNMSMAFQVKKKKSKKNHNVQRKIITETCLIMYKEKAYRKGGCHWHPMLCHLKHQFPGMQ
jgi:hypothetical protein